MQSTAVEVAGPSLSPLVSPARCSKVMRVHAAVAGRHTRHGQLLPLEVYLEEGIPLVSGVLPRLAWYPAGKSVCALCGWPGFLLLVFCCLVCGCGCRHAGTAGAVPAAQSKHPTLLPHSVRPATSLDCQVLHVRDYPYATLCELCEQSLHAFVSFNTVACTQPALKVGHRLQPTVAMPAACMERTPVPHFLCGDQVGMLRWKLVMAPFFPLPPLPLGALPASLPPGVLQRSGPCVGAGQLLPPGEAGHTLLGNECSAAHRVCSFLCACGPWLRTARACPPTDQAAL